MKDLHRSLIEILGERGVSNTPGRAVVLFSGPRGAAASPPRLCGGPQDHGAGAEGGSAGQQGKSPHRAHGKRHGPDGSRHPLEGGHRHGHEADEQDPGGERKGKVRRRGRGHLTRGAQGPPADPLPPPEAQPSGRAAHDDHRRQRGPPWSGSPDPAIRLQLRHGDGPGGGAADRRHLQDRITLSRALLVFKRAYPAGPVRALPGLAGDDRHLHQGGS